MTDQEKKKVGKLGTAIGIIIFLILVFGFAYWIISWDKAEQQKMLDKGCTPSGASNYLGSPSSWSCFDPKETQKYIDMGCTPLSASDEHTKYWSCPTK